ncbi:antibiotic biosynthesis monooxygenase [Streptomyces cupreus]|uniref:Antibiotic biosynthesis monooxygenase n=1 Tax=Streptomyces cupreus TaxID=2759956 RepID=A0A7X1M7W5_9ACTN|nr:antibiotic biosynthesis monooxygenase [Streptomyces cupreus]MBC2901584.1 antibiotic biosynthesis monooxygenase [Streptomyces cupreus]
MTTVELTRFRVPPDRAQELLDARPGMIGAFRTDRHGFLGAQLVRIDDEEWLDIVWWAVADDLDASQAKGGNLPAVQAFFAPISELLSSERGALLDATAQPW